MQKVSSESRLKRFPYWLRQRVRDDEDFTRTRGIISELGLNTVCQSARCPNIYECFSAKRCTFLILVKFCTRTCGFCAINNLSDPVGRREKRPTGSDREELLKIRDAVKKLN